MCKSCNKNKGYESFQDYAKRVLEADFQAEDKESEEWVLCRFKHDFDLIEEAARAKRMSLDEFVVFAAVEYADLYLSAYDAALVDIATQIKEGWHD